MATAGRRAPLAARRIRGTSDFGTAWRVPAIVSASRAAACNPNGRLCLAAFTDGRIVSAMMDTVTKATVATYRALAEEMAVLALNGKDDFLRERYAILAVHWKHLAEQLERRVISDVIGGTSIS